MSLDTIPVAEVALKYDIPLKRLAGHILRNEYADPIGGYDEKGEPVVLDDWRLAKLSGEGT